MTNLDDTTDTTADETETASETTHAFSGDYAPDDPCRVTPDGVPPALRERSAVNWAIEGDRGKVPKRPDAPARNAKSSDAATWGDFEDALAVAQDRDDRGVGFPCAEPGHPFIFLDIDIPEGGDWLPPLDRLGGATAEYSPSGNLRVILRDVTVPDWWTNQSGDGARTRELGIYDDSGYVTLTGDLVGPDADPDPAVGETTQTAFEAFLRDVWRAFNSAANDDAAPWNTDETASTTGTRGQTQSWESSSDYPDAADVLPAGVPEGERTSHPIHDSTSGTNFLLDAGGETFRCWRCDATGNGMHYLGMDAGLIECGDWLGAGLDDETWSDICDYARTEGYDIPDRSGGAPGGERFEQAETAPDGGATTATASSDTTTDTPASATVTTAPWVEEYRQYVEYAEERGDELSQTQKRAKAAELLADRREYIARWPESDPDRVPLWRYAPEDGIFKSGAVGRIEAELTELGEMLDFGDADRRAVVKNVRRRAFTDSDTFDAGDYDNSLVAVENGVLNVEKGEFHDHSPEYRLRSKLPVEYDPDAECPRIDAFLSRVTDGDDVAKQTLYEWIGYNLVDDYPIHAFLLLHGDGGNGKGVFLNLLTEFLGGDQNVSNVGLSKITSDDRFALAQLDGKLANVDRDIPGRSISTEQLTALKKLAAGEQKQVEHKNQDPFTLQNSAKLAFAANEPPRFYEASDSVARRLLDIEFPRSFAGTADEISEEQLEAELFADEELSGLLNRALDAVQTALDRDAFALQTETDMTERFGDYMADADPIVASTAECIEERPGHAITKDAFYDIHVQHARENGREPAGKAVFFRQVKKKTGISFVARRDTINGDTDRYVHGVWPSKTGERLLTEEHVEGAVKVMDGKHPENAAAAHELAARFRDRKRDTPDLDADDDDDGDGGGETTDAAAAADDVDTTVLTGLDPVDPDATGPEATKHRIIRFIAKREAEGHPRPGGGEVAGAMARRHDVSNNRTSDLLDALLEDGRLIRQNGGFETNI